MRHILYLFFLLFALIFFHKPIYSAEKIKIKIINDTEYILLNDLISLYKFESSFDLISQKGKLYYKNHYTVYNIGFSVLIIDGKLYKSKNFIYREKGRVFLPIDASESILMSFFPSIVVLKKNNELQISFKKESKHLDLKKKVVDNKLKYFDSTKDKIKFIVIDSGHGGKDPGAIGKGGLKEKEITLAISKYLETELQKRLKGIKIVLTRRKDRFIELAKRTEKANKLLKKNANGIFLSIHVNASISKRISGYETYFLSQNPSNEEARNTAALENNVIILENKSKSIKSFGDVDYIEAMMITTQIQKESSILANSTQKGMAKKITKFKSRGVKKADFFVLRGVLMPAVLIEIGFITNASEAIYLKKKNHQLNIAKGITEGVVQFIKRYNKIGI